ncbi:DUF2971 domain-containing protein [Arcobacter peruensis]|uniref:DUF2971 domain-containing protein n=1 Tax=Arcobacter peruensis TaxID=2320140 RepID=UPI000F0927CD|nr:DUF2971 domain-containing protein [Arcobacter peruensis]
MIKYLYKYMNLRPSFFNEPMLRATPVYALNDPFEGMFNHQQIKNANKTFDEYYSKNGIEINKNENEEEEDYQIEQMMGCTQSEIFDLGIVSLTEDHINPLMWSHYADEHKGVVIEFLKDVPLYEDSLQSLDGKLSRFGKDYLGEIYEYPERIIYKRVKPTFEYGNELSPDSVTDFHWKKFNKSILFTKSDDWSYEKEHRSVVRLKDADRIICEDDKFIRKICKNNKDIELIVLKKNQIQVTYPKEYEMMEDMGDESIKDEIYRLASMGYNSTVMHFFRINPKCISGIYFGCKSNEQKAIKNLNKNKKLKHIDNINKMDIDDDSYSLITKKY